MAENPRTTAARDADDSDIIDTAIAETEGGAVTGSAGGSVQRDVGSQSDLKRAVDDPDGTARPEKANDMAAGSPTPPIAVPTVNRLDPAAWAHKADRMPDDTPTRNIALLIDADNASWHAIDPVLTVLAELGTVNIRRVYGNWSKQSLKGWRDMTVRHGIEPQQQFDLTKGKNATDMKMTIDAMDLLFRGRVEGFGIMSSDSDFMPLAMRIRQDGLPVYGFGEQRTPEAFKQACTRFIDVAALVADVPVPQPAEVPIDQSLPPSIGRGGNGKTKAPVDPDLLKLLIDAYDATKRDERGFVSLSSMGQLAANRSSFDARNYGYRRLSDLIEAVPNFQTERRENGRSYVRRVR